MIFITVTRTRGGDPLITIRADHILQMNGTSNEEVTTWLLLDRLGWLGIKETQEEVLRKIADARSIGPTKE